MTKKEVFQRDEVKRSQLAEALPVVLEALESLKDELEVGHNNLAVTNDTVGNSLFQQSVGARHLIRGLPGMVKEWVPPKTVEPRRQFTEEDRPMLKERLQK